MKGGVRTRKMGTVAGVRTVLGKLGRQSGPGTRKRGTVADRWRFFQPLLLEFVPLRTDK